MMMHRFVTCRSTPVAPSNRMLQWMMIVDSSSSSSCSLPWSLFDQRRLIHQEKKKHTSVETKSKRQQYKTTHSKEAPLSRDATKSKSPSKPPPTKAKKDRWTDVEGSRQYKRQLARSQGGLPPNAATTSRRNNDDEAPLTRSSTLPTRSRTTTKPFATTRRHPESTRKSPAPVSIQHDRRDYPPEALDVYIACHAGLQSLLYAEIDHLRLPYIPKGFGASLLAPVSVDDLLTCHLYLGTAAHVFVRCGPSWDARALGEVQRKTAEMPWRYMLPDASSTGVLLPRLQVKVTATKSRLLHTTAIRDHVLKGIYAALGIPDAWNANDDDTATDRSPDTTRLSVQLYRDNVQISLDTSETPIHQRGYRLETCKAPLREDLAYALLFSAGWKPRYTWTPRQGHFVPSPSDASPLYTALLDPFCGSGTLPIEAAAMAAGLPPGRLRPAPLRGTPLYDPPRWDALVQKARHCASSSPQPAESSFLIAASDRDAGAVRSTAANAARAGVPPLQLQQCAFTQHPWWSSDAAVPSHTLLAANLPFGRRISALATAPPPNYAKHPLLPLYQSLGNHMRGSWPRGAVFLTDDRELLRHGGFAQPFTTTLSTTHGGIPVVGMCMQRRAEEEKDDGVVVENTAAA